MWVKRSLIVILMLALLGLTGCALGTETGHTSGDAPAAQSFFPNVPGYNVQATNSVQDAIVTALGGASLLSGNPIQAALVMQVDRVIDCYRDVGAVDARIYVEQLSNLDSVRVPVAGVLAVINQDRVRDNFLACISQTPLDGMFRSQAAQPEPCYGSGTFRFGNDTISYLFAATDRPLCQSFEAHFRQFGG